MKQLSLLPCVFLESRANMATMPYYPQRLSCGRRRWRLRTKGKKTSSRLRCCSTSHQGKSACILQPISVYNVDVNLNTPAIKHSDVSRRLTAAMVRAVSRRALLIAASYTSENGFCPISRYLCNSRTCYWRREDRWT